MDHFQYRDGRLFGEEVSLHEVAARVGTPAYVYSAATLRMHYDRLAAAFAELKPLICYSVKSSPNLSILRELVSRGSGLDVVSGGELHRARLAGCPMSRVVYAGVGKTDEEVRDALGFGDPVHNPPQAGASTNERTEPIFLFNIESEGEFQAVANIAQSRGVVAHAALRVNPDVDPHTHVYTTTGKAETKFGVDLERARLFFKRFGKHPNLRLTGLHTHLGSPVRETGPYVDAIKKVLELVDELAADGYTVETLDLGGGFAADYTTGASKNAAEYAAAIVPLLKDRVAKGLKIVLEPGRTISANAGVLLTRVLYVKQSGAKKFLVCDAGMHTLLRPSLYQAFHFIWPAAVSPQHEITSRAEKPDVPGLENCDVVGPICESGDFLAKDRPLPPVAPGDLLVVYSAGAYGISMSSRYNSHPTPAEVLIDGSRVQLIRRREVYHDLVEHELNVEDI